MQIFRVLFLYLSLNAQVVNKDVECIARAMYFESANQKEIGKIAVGHVILNRMNMKHKDACSIVYEFVGKSKQFRWDHHKKIPSNDARWPKCLELSKNIHKYSDPTNGAIFFHAKYVKPTWTKKKKFTVKIQDHLFYK